MPSCPLLPRFVAALACLWIATASAQTGVVRGQVFDATTAEPLARVSVETSPLHRTATGEDGRFELALPQGPQELRVSTVGYGILKRPIHIVAGSTLELMLRLGPEALHVAESVTVNAGPFDHIVPDAPTEYALDQRELSDLSTVLASDPLRAVAALPGVTSNQDFYADFAVRGADSSHIGVFSDGVLIEHPAYSLEDNGTIGSLSVINGDVVESVALLSGGFPIEYGNRTGAVLDIKTRDGAIDRIVTRATADFLGAGLTSEGPLNRARKASWLVSGRQSYLGYLLDRLGISNNLTLNYRDATAKLAGDVSRTQRLVGYAAVGATTASRNPITVAGQTNSFFTNGAAEHMVAYIGHTWTPGSRVLLVSKGFWTRDHEHNTNPSNVPVLDTTTNAGGGRSDLTLETLRAGRFRAGVEIRTSAQERFSFTQWDYSKDVLQTSLRPLDNYTAQATLSGGYLAASESLAHGRLTADAGLRWSVYAPTAQTALLPQATVRLRLRDTTSVTAAFAQYAQNPALQQRFGAFGTNNLLFERATHWNFSVDQAIGSRGRLHAEWYDREDRNGIFSELTEFRLLGTGAVGFPKLGPVLTNKLDGTARGFEIEFHQRTANRLSGWIGYSYSHAQKSVPSTPLRFDSDTDQRHSLTVYAAYRITKTIDLSGNLRYGSGVPIPGFLSNPIATSTSANTAVTYQLSAERNTARAGTFFRADARLSKVWIHDHFNLTLKGELENLTAKSNYNFYQFVFASNVASTKLGNGRRESTLPLLPAAGLLIEF